MAPPMSEPVTLEGPVLVVGAGLLGTSIGLALRRRGVAVWFRDVSTENLRTALGLGAGQLSPDIAPPPQLVVVAVPPNVIGETLRWALTHHPKAVVTDVGSIKTGPLEQLRAYGLAGLSRYVGGHPMAGSERSGPLAASAALFDGRPWAVTPHQDSSREAVDLVLELVAAVGATAVQMSPDEHDRAVARTSHLPHLLASLVAGRLAEAPPGHLALSGQGVRDVTRVAAGDPELWQQIVSGQRAGRRAPAGRGTRAAGRPDRRRLEGPARRADPDPGPGRGRHAGHPGQARRADAGHRVGLRLGARPGRASWPGCSRTPARAGSTSRTCASTTTPAARPVWSSWSSPTTAPSTCWPLWNLVVG